MTIALVFDVDRTRVRIESGPVALFEAHRQTRFYHREAGGQLFGNVGRTRWTVSHATGPDQRDRRSRFGFRPDRGREQQEIEAYHAHGFDYLGDWHTHPENVPKPSERDLLSIDEIVRRSTHHLPGFLLCIVGRLDFPSGIWLSFHDQDGQVVRGRPLTS
ncbi:Mov34/MPN/PAD-1 family protein [Enterovirga aerilata]|uniref:JAB domain-containing protein n=1 Tax=Enterovirga aerilata TaxID=2730920 RepID=A0A849ICS5_9HYPH|nr:Mov34/MPN/PAD-1 family protein [Enterovirga sp. DB1703]NNM73840.1 hypothetical protein [Enterovirga sp. DB1703]